MRVRVMRERGTVAEWDKRPDRTGTGIVMQGRQGRRERTAEDKRTRRQKDRHKKHMQREKRKKTRCGNQPGVRERSTRPAPGLRIITP